MPSAANSPPELQSDPTSNNAFKSVESGPFSNQVDYTFKPVESVATSNQGATKPIQSAAQFGQALSHQASLYFDQVRPQALRKETDYSIIMSENKSVSCQGDRIVVATLKHKHCGQKCPGPTCTSVCRKATYEEFRRDCPVTNPFLLGVRQHLVVSVEVV